MKIGSKSRRDFNLSLASNGRSAAKKVVRGVHARERRKERGEKRALFSRAFIYAHVYLLVSGVLLDGLLRKKRDCSYSRMITIHGVPNS